MDHIFFIYFLTESYLDGFQFLSIINKAAMNIVEQLSLLDGGVSFGYIPRSGISGS